MPSSPAFTECMVHLVSMFFGTSIPIHACIEESTNILIIYINIPQEPEPIILNKHDLSSHWEWDRTKVFTYKNKYGYYISIIKTLENLLRNPEELQTPHNQTNGNLGGICDGYFVKQELENMSNIPLLHLL